MEVERRAGLVFTDKTSTARMHRSFPELARWLVSALRFPAGVVLLTGTGIVPGAPFTLTAGDTVRIMIEPLGTLTNPVELLQTGPSA